MESDERSPLKRDKRLYPLSHAHHGGLVFSLRLKKGVAQEADTNKMRDYIQYFWRNELVRHFQEEEEHLLPLLSDRNSLKKQTLYEHTQIRNTVDQIMQDPTLEQIKELGTLVDNHIRFEERVLFPYLEKNLTQVQLDQIGKALTESDFCDTWTEEFWK